MERKTIVIVPAAGTGKRFEKDFNKAFFEIMGKPIFIRALEQFQRYPSITEIIPVFSEIDMDKGLELIEEYGITKVKKIAPGGRERQDSVYNALKLIDNSPAVTVIVHDGVRPFVEEEMVTRCIKALKSCDGVVTAVPVKDTIKQVKDTRVEKTLNRQALVSIQTPQAFRYKTLLNAYARIRGRKMFTDDAAVVEHTGGRIHVVEGSYRNIKVTTPDDALIVEAFLKAEHGNERDDVS